MASDRNQKVDRHRGGQEPPPEAQDRPEQNAGYDEAVRTGPPRETADPIDAGELIKEGALVEAPDSPTATKP